MPIRLTLECFGFTSTILSVYFFFVFRWNIFQSRKNCFVERIPFHLNGVFTLLLILISPCHVIYISIKCNIFGTIFQFVIAMPACQAACAICFGHEKQELQLLKCNFSPKRLKDVTRRGQFKH